MYPYQVLSVDLVTWRNMQSRSFADLKKKVVIGKNVFQSLKRQKSFPSEPAFAAYLWHCFKMHTSEQDTPALLVLQRATQKPFK